MMGVLQRLATAITIISHRKKGITQQPQQKPPKHKKRTVYTNRVDYIQCIIHIIRSSPDKWVSMGAYTAPLFKNACSISSVGRACDC